MTTWHQRSDTKLYRFAQHCLVVVTILGITFTGTWVTFPAGAADTPPPAPLSSDELTIAHTPDRLLLPAHSADEIGWASTFDGLWQLQGDGFRIVEPSPTIVNNVPYIAYRVWERAESYDIEFPSAQGSQLIRFLAASLSYSLFEKPRESSEYIRLAQQTLSLQYRSVSPDATVAPSTVPESTATPEPAISEPPSSESPEPSTTVEPTVTPPSIPEPSSEITPDEPSAFLQLLGVRSAYAEADLDYSWYPAHVSHIETTLSYDHTDAVLMQTFRVDIDGIAHVGSVSTRIGFDGNPINKWTYAVAGDEHDITMRAVTKTSLAGTAVHKPDGSGSRFTLSIGKNDEELLDVPAAPPVQAPEIPDDATEPTPAATEQPAVSAEPTITEAPAPEPVNGSPDEPLNAEPPLPETPTDQPAPAEPPPDEAPVAPVSMLDSLFRRIIPTAHAADDNTQSEGPGMLERVLDSVSNILGTKTDTFTILLKTDDAGVPEVTYADNVATTVYAADETQTPVGYILFVDPGFATQQNAQGITVQSGDGTRTSDFKVHFNPFRGGAIDELYTGGDFTFNRVSTPASDSGGLTLITTDQPQSSRTGTLTISEASPVRVVVHNELSDVTEDYAIYPSGRMAKRIVIDAPHTEQAIFRFNAALSAFDADAAELSSKIQLITSGTGPDLVSVWEDSAILASAAFSATQSDISFVTQIEAVLPAGQTTLHQLIELSQQGLTLLDSVSYMPFADDWRNPDNPIMTRGTFQGFSAARAAYQMEAVNNVAVFRLDGSVYPRINPTFEISSWSDPDLDAFKAQLNGHDMQEGTDYVIGFQNSDSSTGILLFQYLHTVQIGDVFSAQGDESLPPLFDLDPTDGAAIRRVQRGTHVMATGSTSDFITLPFPVVTSRSFVIAGSNFGGANGTPSDPEKSREAFWLASPTQLRIDRTSSGSVASSSYEVVEFVDAGSGSTAGAFVQRGSTSFAIGDTSLNVTLPTAVSTNKAFALVTVRGGSTDQTNDEEWTLRASLSATTLNLSRNESGIALVATWQVVQLDGISVQRGLTTLSGATVTNVTLPTSVNVNKSFVISSARATAADAGNDGQYHYMISLTSSTNLRINKYNATNGVDVAWFVVTFSGTSGNRVRRGVQTYTASLTDFAHTASISPSVVATRSMSFATAAGAPGGDTADLDALTFGEHSLNTAGGGLVIRRNYAGNVRAASASWEVTEFTRPNIQQNRFRWRNDNGSETTATWAATENTSISMAFNTIYRLRFGLYDADSGSSTNQYRLSFVRKTAAGNCVTGLSPGWSWRDIPVAPSGASDSFDLENSANITEGAATTNVAGGLTDDDTTFIAGDTRDTSNQTASIGLASTSFTEIEYALRANSNALAGGKYCFRVTDAGDANASKSFIFYPRYAETTVSVQPTFTQNAFRWYVNTNAVSPTDPWTAGGSDLDQNQSIDAQFSPPASSSSIRLRMSLQDGAGLLGLRAASFSLQFAEVPVGSFQCSAVVSWTDVAASTSTAAAWSFGSNAGVTNGVSAGTLLLSQSDRLGTYQEANPTALNPASASAGEDIEYDFVLRNVSAAASSRFCFRMSMPQGTALSSYADYPSMVTQPSPYKMQDVMRHGAFFSVQGEEQPQYWSDIF